MADQALSKTEVSLHWIVGIGMIAMIAVGIYMEENEVFSLYGIHKSIGVLLFVVILWRVLVRVRQGWPDNISTGAAWEHWLAKIIHWVLILGTIAMPISGMVDSLMAGRGLSIFGLELVGMNMGAEGKPVAINEGLSDTASRVHALVGKVMIGAILLHVAGALKHHVIDRDNTLRRMTGRA